MEQNKKPKKWGWLILFTTSSTLICCALPIALVSLGLGAVVASVASSAPWLIWLTQKKAWVFGITGLILLITAWALYRPNRSCPADPKLGKYCTKAHKWNSIIYIISVILWGISFLTSYILPIILY